MSLLGGFKRAARRFAAPPHAVILAYHSVLEVDGPFPIWQHMTRARFEQHLDWLARHCTCVSLSELLAYCQDGRYPPRCVAVTFDDGFANNLHVALPLLEQRRIPAAFFIASGFVRSNRLIWPEALACVLAASEKREMTFADEIYSLADPSAKSQSYKQLAQRLRRAAPQDVQSELLAIAVAAQVDLSGIAGMPLAEAFRMMSVDELKRLASSDLVEIGAHTVNHHPLSALTQEQAAGEISDSKKMLEEAVGEVRYFAYPYGSHRDFNAGHRALLQAQGFEAAFSAHPACVAAGVDRYAIPRMAVGCDRSHASLEYSITGGLALAEGRRRWRPQPG